MTTYLFLHLYNDMEWLDAYDAESLHKAFVAARLNHFTKNADLQLIYINPELMHLVDVSELTH